MTIGEGCALGVELQRTCSARAHTMTWARVLRKSLLAKALRWFPGDADCMMESSQGKKGSGAHGVSEDD